MCLLACLLKSTEKLYLSKCINNVSNSYLINIGNIQTKMYPSRKVATFKCKSFKK